MSKDELKEAIRQAFDGVELGEGIGLREGNAIDDYKSDADQVIERQSDEKHDWSRITAEDLERYRWSLSYFDPAGMRFHLPAFMLARIDHGDDSLLNSLIALDEYSLSRYTALSSAQRRAVVAFLYWVLEDPADKWHHAAIERALLEYWESDANSPP